MSRPRVEIVGYRPDLAADFQRLNVEWLEKYFEVEPVDEEVLGDPQTHIIDPGGDILFAQLGEEVVGACALKHQGGGVYELTKMCITAAAQGSGAGRALLRATIERYLALGGARLYLETHSSLAPAIHLYETEGFEHAPRSEPSPYERSNVYMIYRESGKAG